MYPVEASSEAKGDTVDEPIDDATADETRNEEDNDGEGDAEFQRILQQVRVTRLREMQDKQRLNMISTSREMNTNSRPQTSCSISTTTTIGGDSLSNVNSLLGNFGKTEAVNPVATIILQVSKDI